MEINKKSYKQIFAFINAASAYMEADKETSVENKTEDTKLTYALTRVLENMQPIIDAYKASVKDIQLEHALEDERGKVTFTINIKTGEREYDYTKEGLKALDKALETLFNTEVDVKVYYATSLPEDLAPVYNILFKGFVIKEEPIEQTKN